MDCVTTYCLYPMLPNSVIVDVCLSVMAGLVIWKIVKAIIDTIPVVG